MLGCGVEGERKGACRGADIGVEGCGGEGWGADRCMHGGLCMDYA